jgi:hypothetical protein
MNGRWALVTCEVCRLLDGDLNRKWCQFCSGCNAWICQADIKNHFRRALALAKKKLAGVM